MASIESTDDTIPILPSLEPASGLARGNRRRFATARVILALMLREMTSRYGRSPGGYAWAILEPVGMIIVLSIGFSLLMRVPSLGHSFMLFYASGYLVFAQYQLVEKSVSKSLPYARGLLRYPIVTWLDAILARFILNALTYVLNTILILGTVIYLTAGNMMLDFAPMVEAMTLASLLALGIGSFNALMSGVWPLWTSVWSIVTRPAMIASAVLYVMEDLPTTAANIIWYNPVAHLTGLMRSGVFATYDPQYISVPYVIGVTMVTLSVALVFLRQHASSIISDDRS